MTGLIIAAILILLGIVIVQIGKVTELATKIRGEEEIEINNNRVQGRWLMIFMVLFLIACFWSAGYFKNWLLGYGPHSSASAHGGILDNLFNVTLVFTGIVFVLTHVALFYFSWKYAGKKEQKASFISHNNTLEIVWSAIPAIVMTFLVVKGLVAWNAIMADVGPDEDVIEIEVTGYQFAWHLRYPGPDGALGERDYRMITARNPLGQDWSDTKNLDDLHADEIVLPVGKKVRVRVTSRDVLHSFYLPHFRVKMDAVPGLPTYFVFTPIQTTEEYREKLSQYAEYNIPKEPEDPESPMLWEEYNYELACAELCGSSHFAMRRIVRVVSEAEYEAWLASKNSYYLSNIRGSEGDPFKDAVLDVEVAQRREDLMTAIESLIAAEGEDKLMELKYTEFETGSATLTANSKHEIDYAAEVMNRFPDLIFEVGGHTDNTGDSNANNLLSQQRAEVIKEELVRAGVEASRLIAKGYGDAVPMAENDTEEGRAQNRRTELKIIGQ